MNETQWILAFGSMALACWIAAGFAAVFGTREEILHTHATRAAEVVTFALTILGASSAVAMVLLIVANG
jgi:hypothetical protein